MNGNLLEYYEKLLDRLESIGDISKEAVFDILNLDTEKEVKEALRMTDREFMEKFNLELNKSKIWTQKEEA